MTQDEVDLATQFYRKNYDLVAKYVVVPGPKQFLGDLQSQMCRFCGRRAPLTTFKKLAHAVPESLGNRTLFTRYECDACNGHFGRSIENDFGSWSKPMRTMARLRGKRGIPTIKNSNGSWRLTGMPDGLAVSHDQYDGLFEVDEDRKEIKIKLVRDAYTPVAVLKALIKIGLTILPGAEIHPFTEALAWVYDNDHSASQLGYWPVARTALPGAFAGTLISLMALRRAEGVTALPYAFFILIYGNEMLQIPLPAPAKDAHLHGLSLEIPFFPSPAHSVCGQRAAPPTSLINLSANTVVRGEPVTFTLSYEERTPTTVRTTSALT